MEIQAIKKYLLITDLFKNAQTVQERKSIYKKLILKYHPDKNLNMANPNGSQKSEMFNFLCENKDKLILNQEIDFLSKNYQLDPESE